MAAKKEKEITLTAKDAQALIDLFNNIERADTVYKACQSDLFRSLVSSTYKAPAIERAIASLKAQI